MKFFNKIVKLIKKCFNKNMEIAQESWSHNANPTSTVEIRFSADGQEDSTTCESGILASDIEEDDNSTNYAEPLNSSIATDSTSDDEQFQESPSCQTFDSKNLEKKPIVPTLNIKEAIEYAIEEAGKKPATATKPNSSTNLSSEILQLSSDGWT